MGFIKDRKKMNSLHRSRTTLAGKSVFSCLRQYLIKPSKSYEWKTCLCPSYLVETGPAVRVELGSSPRPFHTLTDILAF